MAGEVHDRVPRPAHVRQHTCQEFIELASQVLGRRVHRVAKLTEIWEGSADSGALPHDPQSVAVQTFLFTLRHYQNLNDMRRQLEEQAQRLLASDADYINLMSLPGVGPINALIILAEAGNLRRFGHHRQFLKFCGFDLAKSQSGVHRGREQLSKRGNARLRLAFWLAAIVAVRARENSFRERYDRYVSSNPKDQDLKRKALTAVAAKMARVAYGIVKKGQPYRRFFDQSLPSGTIPLSCAVGAPA